MLLHSLSQFCNIIVQSFILKVLKSEDLELSPLLQSNTLLRTLASDVFSVLTICSENCTRKTTYTLVFTNNEILQIWSIMLNL